MKGLIQKYSGILYFCLDFPLNVLNYLFVVILSSYLIPVDYGRANALLALLAIFITPGIALQSAVAKHLAEYETTTVQLDRVSLFYFIGWIALLFAISPILGIAFDSNLVVILVLVMTIAVHLYLSWWRGLLQGIRAFLRLSSSMYSEIVLKFVLAVVLLKAFTRPEIVIVCILIAYTATLIWTAIQIRPNEPQQLQLSLVRDVLPFIFQLSFIQICMNLDLLMMNQFNSAQSGFYAATIRYGQLIAYVMLSFQVVIIPFLARRYLQFNLFYIVMGYILLGSIIVAGYKYIIPYTIPFFFSIEYIVIIDELPWVALSYLIYAFLNLLILLFILRKSDQYKRVMLFVMLSLSVFYPLMSGSIRSMLHMQLLVYSVACIFLLYYYVYYMRKQPILD